MTLTELRTALVAAATGTDIVSVIFDYNKKASTIQSKDYPLVLWDFVGMDGVKPIRSADPKSTLTIYVWAVKKHVPDSDNIPEWDSLITDLDEYLLSVNEQTFVTVDLTNVAWAPFPPGFFSVDRELPIRYRVTLTLWC
ncbi:MAG: hypothetical protein KAS04_06265 [Candidatus Aenigmarchaeota archaeon]|nr:hypothetical protein [Candidatus Aenigmarchaeota archaeon]